ncbi:ATP-binding protein [Paraglaciecola sp. 20A4]|uniref:AAA family ATPase n=1 Tax=Paraglaciecola sp. 20A4 TaxID=2687288 RepID=UPI00140DB4FC|nr:ATP-binding protein [Paraglaciecola sp. 20A4]
MIQKIVFLGAPSTGKSTLSEALAHRLNTLSVAEYGREYWIEHQVDRRLSPEQLLHIAQIQNQWEDEAEQKAQRYLFCDTNAFTTWHFACHYHTTPLPELTKLAHASWQRYDLVVLCDNDIPYDDTWERSGDANRSEFQHFLEQYLVTHGIHFIKVSGTVESRVTEVMRALKYLKPSPRKMTSAVC